MYYSGTQKKIVTPRWLSAEKLLENQRRARRKEPVKPNTAKPDQVFALERHKWTDRPRCKLPGGTYSQPVTSVLLVVRAL